MPRRSAHIQRLHALLGGRFGCGPKGLLVEGRWIHRRLGEVVRSAEVDTRLLGPLKVVDDGGYELAVGAGRQPALLALLLFGAGELVAGERLLRGESAPPTAHRMLLDQVSALCRVLGRDSRLETSA